MSSRVKALSKTFEERATVEKPVRTVATSPPRSKSVVEEARHRIDSSTSPTKPTDSHKKKPKIVEEPVAEASEKSNSSDAVEREPDTVGHANGTTDHEAAAESSEDSGPNAEVEREETAEEAEAVVEAAKVVPEDSAEPSAEPSQELSMERSAEPSVIDEEKTHSDESVVADIDVDADAKALAKEEKKRLKRSMSKKSHRKKKHGKDPLSGSKHRHKHSKKKVSAELASARQDLLVAVLSRDFDAVEELLGKVKELAQGFISHKEGKDGLTLLHRCVIQGGASDVMRVLIDNGIEVDVPNTLGLTCLHVAAQKGDLAAIVLLLENSANSMAKDFENKTALHHAARAGNLECSELLISKNVLVNHKDNFGDTALHLAVKQERKPVVKMLVGHHADPMLLNNVGQRPIDLLPNFNDVLFRKGKLSGLSTEGKSILAFLKKKGGLRRPTSMKMQGVGGGAFRSRSLDHRRKQAQTTAYVPGLGPGIQVNVPLAHSEDVQQSVQQFERKKELKKEMRLSQKQLRKGLRESKKATSKVEAKEESEAAKPAEDIKYDTRGFRIKDNHAEMVGSASKKKTLKQQTKWIALVKSLRGPEPREEKMKKYHAKIQKYCDRGIPDTLRGQVWQFLAGSEEAAEASSIAYEDISLDDVTEKNREQVLKDIPRTMPEHMLFLEGAAGQELLTNVLLKYTVYKPEVGYCQGMGFITAMFLIYMTEEDAFWMLDRIAQSGFAEIWEFEMRRVTMSMHALNELIKDYLPKVYHHLEELGVPPLMYAPQYFITGYIYNLPFYVCVRIWDSFLARDFLFFYATALSLYKLSHDRLLAMEMENLMKWVKLKELIEDGGQMGFTEEQLIHTAISYHEKLKPERVEALEQEGADNKRKVKEERENRK